MLTHALYTMGRRSILFIFIIFASSLFLIEKAGAAPLPPVITKASCTGTSITTSFESTGALHYAVRLINLSDTINDPDCLSKTPNDTCQWQNEWIFESYRYSRS